MSHTNHTQYYELPQYVGSDIINPLVDTNGAYETIDTTMHNIATEAAQGTSDIAALQTKVGSASLYTTAQNLSGAVNELNDELDDASTGIKARLTTAENDIDALQGQMVTAQGNIVDLQNNKASASDVSALQTTVGDANSGLVKTVADNTARLNEFGTHLIPYDIETTFVNIVADGVKDYETLLNELHSAIANYINSAPDGEYIKIDYMHIDGIGNFAASDAYVLLNSADMSSHVLAFNKTYTDGTSLFVAHNINVGASNSKMDYCSSDGTTMTFHAGETDVPASGVNFHLRGMTYKLI